MNSVTTQVEPRYAPSARVDAELTHTYEKIKSVDEEIARAREQLSRLERAGAAAPSKSRRGRPALRGLAGLLLAAGIGTAALISQSSYGDPFRQMITGWAPLRAATSPQAQAEPARDAQPGPTAQLAEAPAASPQPAPVAETMPEAVTPAASPLPPELTELLGKLASDLANVQQGIDELKTSQAQLKANQEQMSLDSARLADELKAGQEQMARLVARTPEKTSDRTPENKTPEVAGKTPDRPNAGQKPSAAPVPAPRPAAAATRRPAPATSSPHATMRRAAPLELRSAQQ